MFSVKGYFGDVACPHPDSCDLLNCLFSHETVAASAADQKQIAVAVPTQNRKQQASGGITPTNPSEHAVKRRKIEHDGKESLAKPVSEPIPRSAREEKPFMGILTSAKPASSSKAQSKPSTTASNSSLKKITTAQRPISPPPLHKSEQTNGAKLVLSKSKPEIKEVLNPRLLEKPPTGHAVRRQCLQKLHECMARLNDEASKSSDPETKSISMSKGGLIKAALDEEEKLARDQPLVYANIIKHRIMAYKKMKLDEWKKSRLDLQEANTADPNKPRIPKLETGLSEKEEVVVVLKFVAAQDGLDKHGYVTSQPTKAQLKDAEEGLRMAAGWEVCDRCQTRFQVFPNRREDGALTGGGSCTHHWGRPYQPKREKSDAITGVKEKKYGCCERVIGSPGCTENATHVFKTSDPKRLALVLPFEETPANGTAQPDKAVCFDCEMGYTCYGLELIRLTATSWPSGAPLLDVLVRPVGNVLDLNTRFSGVTADQFFSAPEYFAGSTINDPSNLHIVSSPAVARELLLSHLSPDTPLIGHALENDLNSVRLIHPSIVDTIFLYPHPRGLPLRFGLRHLTKQFLHRDIQTAGAAGHDSLEDARATGDLVRVKVGKEWTRLKIEGWTVKDGSFFPPRSSVAGPLPIAQPCPGRLIKKPTDSSVAAVDLKRKSDGISCGDGGGGSESTEPLSQKPKLEA